MTRKVVNIFLTDSIGDVLEDFEHENLLLKFSSMDSQGPRRLSEGPILCFIDWLLDDMSGLELCRRLRANPVTQNAHLTMVLDHDGIEERRRALAAGADNYIVGPVERDILLDHAMALHADQQQRHATKQIRIGELSIDSTSFLVSWRGKPVLMRPNQFRLLRFFAEHPNELMTRREVIHGLGKVDEVLDERTVDVWIKRLRRNLRDAGVSNLLRTVHGRGYVLDLP